MEINNPNVIVSSNVAISLESHKGKKTLFGNFFEYDEVKLEFKNGFYVLPWSNLHDQKAALVKNGRIKVIVKMSVSGVSVKS